MTEDSFSTPRLPRRAPLLGQILLERGLINSQQLEAALARQRQLGGSLGTILLESEAITEVRLLEMLGVQLSMPTVSAAEMQDIPRDVLDLIPARLAHRYNLLPFRRSGNTLHMATLDPGAVFPVEDEIRMLTSCLLRAHIGLDFRIRDAIRQHYGGPGNVRLQSLARRLALAASRVAAAPRKVRPEAPIDGSIVVAPPEAPATVDGTAAADGGWADRSPVSELDVDRLVGLIDRLSGGGARKPVEGSATASPSDENAADPASAPSREARLAELGDLPTDRSGAATSAPPDEARLGRKPAVDEPPVSGVATPAMSAAALEPSRGNNPFAGLDLAGTEASGAVAQADVALLSTDPGERLMEVATLLQDVELRDDVADAVLAYCAPFFSRRLLFARRRGQILGWRGEGEAVDLKILPTVALPAAEPSIFSRLETPGAMHCGGLAPLPLHRLLEPLCGRPLPAECVVIPILLGSKVACYLWLDNAGGDLAGAPLSEIQELARKAGFALEICVLRNRIGSR